MIEHTSTLLGLFDDTHFLDGGRYSGMATVMEAARMMKASSKVATFLDIAGWAGEIAAIVVEAIAGAVMRDKLRGYVPKLQTSPFPCFSQSR
jgi:hypothetical protein